MDAQPGDAVEDGTSRPPPAPAFERYTAYIHGFDPAGADKYASMFATGATRWARWRGVALDVDGPHEVAPHVTRLVLTARPDGSRPVRCTLEILGWDDIVKRHWPEHPLVVRARVLWCFWRTIETGTLAWLQRWSWPTLVSAALPGATTTLQLLALIVVASIGAAIASGGMHPAWSVVPVLLLALLWFARRHERANHWSWAGRFIDFARLSVPADPLGAGEGSRHDLFVRRIAERMDADDAVVIGHSGGAQEAVSVAASLTRCAPDARPPLLMTLGSLLILVSWQRGARWLQDALARLARSPGLRWVDVSSPPDPACVAMVDPVEATFGTAAMGPAFRGPQILNARFHANMPPNRYARARRDRVHMHFLYLRPVPETERDDDYDLYAMLLHDGPAEARLGDRSGRPPFARAAEHPSSPGVRAARGRD